MSDHSGRIWLMLSYFAGIDGMACSQHIDDRLGPLRERGVTPLLLTGICGDPSKDISTVRVPSLGPSGIRFELRHLQRKKRWLKFPLAVLNLLLLPLYLLEKLCIDLDSQWSWFPLAIRSGNRLCRKHGPELIYSTGGPASAHLAAAVISRRHHIPWIAELQDPLVHGDWLRSKRALKVFTWLERLICIRADAVIFLTDEARLRSEQRTGLGSRGWTIYPGSNPGVVPQTAYEKGSLCRFAHFGSLGGSRNLKVFLEGLRLLLNEQPDLAKKICLDLYGTCDRLSRRLIADFPEQSVIHDHGRIPRGESLVAMKRCDVLLLIQNTEEFSAETIPSKTYEYLHMGRPILGLLHNNREFERMLTHQGHVAVAANSAVAVKQGIRVCYETWADTSGIQCEANSPYTVSSAVDSLIKVTDSLSSATLGGRNG